MSSTRRPKRFLSPDQKYDLWVRMLTGQLNQTNAAAEAGLDRTTIAASRKVTATVYDRVDGLDAGSAQAHSPEALSELGTQSRGPPPRRGDHRTAIELAALRGKRLAG